MEGRTYPLTRVIDLVVRHLPRPEHARVALDEALGAYAAEDVLAPVSVPATPTAACDGFYLHQGAEAGTYRVAGSCSILQPPPGPPEPGAAWRIEEGTALPPGGAIVPITGACLVGTDTVRLETPSTTMIRTPGAVLKAGARVVARGRRINENEWALLAACGLDGVDVLSPPAVQVLAIGSELDTPAHPEVSGRFLVRFLECLGVPAVFRGVVPDDDERIRKEVVNALRGRLLVVCGGTGRGLADRTVAAIRPGGIRLLCEGINLQPGNRTAAAVGLRGAGLFVPGAPEAALAVAHALLKPIVADWLELDMTTWRAGPRLPLAEPWREPSDDFLFMGGVPLGGQVRITGEGTDSAPFTRFRDSLFSAEMRCLVPPGTDARTVCFPVDG